MRFCVKLISLSRKQIICKFLNCKCSVGLISTRTFHYAKSMQIPVKDFNMGIYNIQNACKYPLKILTWEHSLSHYLSVFCAHRNIFHIYNICTPDNTKILSQAIRQILKKTLWEIPNNNKGGHIYTTHRLSAYERQFAWAGPNQNTQKGCFLHEDILMLELRGLLDCFHSTQLSWNEAHITSSPEVLVNNAIGVPSAISTAVQDSARKYIFPKFHISLKLVGLSWHQVALQSYQNIRKWIIFLNMTF